jgi:hypothetical protein
MLGDGVANSQTVSFVPTESGTATIWVSLDDSDVGIDGTTSGVTVTDSSGNVVFDASLIVTPEDSDVGDFNVSGEASVSEAGWMHTGSYSFQVVAGTTYSLVGSGTIDSVLEEAPILEDFGTGLFSAKVTYPILPMALLNSSARAFVGTGNATLSGSFTVEGASTKQILVRADGPALASYGVSGVLENPVLELDDATTGLAIATNAGWGNAPVSGPSGLAASVRAATPGDSSQVYAFPLSKGSSDCAMVATLPPGTYNVRIRGANNTTGIALAEVFAMDSVPRIVYMSTGGFVGTNPKELVDGFDLSASETVLIRALGPALPQTGSLAAPVLTLYDSGGGVIATNTGWSNAPVAGASSIQAGVSSATASAFAQAGVSPLPNGSGDCAMVVTLPAGDYSAIVSGVGGTTGNALVEIAEIDSWRATAEAPAIVSQTQDFALLAGQSVTLGVDTVGIPTPTYQWQLNGTNIGGATGPSLTLTDVQASAAGVYKVLATGAGGTAISRLESLTVDTPPTIAQQPASQSVNAGSGVVLAVGASGSSALTYQWSFNGSPLTGATSPTLYLSNVQTANSGTYSVDVTDASGNTTDSSSATLTVNPAVAGGIATQPSSQAIATGSTVVFTVAAGGTVGSSLAKPIGQAAALTSGTTYQWMFNGANLTDGGAISGSTGPQLVITGASSANNGDYSCLVTTNGVGVQSNSAGLVVGTVSTPGYLVNISSRAFVGTGDSILIGGFFVGGSTSRSVLIQALGPALTAQGVSGVLQHPALTIHNSSGAVIYSDTGWGSNPVLLKAAASAYAQPVLQPDSADSEVLLTLPPGGYTAEIAGADGGTGVALCAIYQLP